MKYGITIITLAIIIMFVSCDYSRIEIETTEKTEEQSNRFEFSQKSGFYSEDFILEIYAPSNEIYYTLDGTEPNNNSIKYTSGIMINNPSQYLNATNPGISGGYQFVEASDSQKASYYRTDFSEVDTATIIRAIYYDKEGNASEVINGFFKVTAEKQQSVNTISICTDPSNLFGYDNGIYVLGRTFDEYKADPSSYWWATPWSWWDGNFRQKGKDWERKVSLSIYDTDGEEIFDSSCGIRVKGHVSRGFAQKSFNIYFRDE